MGIFYESVEIINRAPVNLSVMFDGQSKTLVPGKNHIPYMTVQFAKNQNPIMGSADPHNPHISGAKYLIGVPGEDLPEDLTMLTEVEWAAHLGQPTRENSQQAFEEKYGDDPKARLVVRGQGRKTTATSRYDATQGAGPRPGSLGGFENNK
jgi:hypothetical protein